MNNETTMLGGKSLEEVQRELSDYAKKHQNQKNAAPEAVRQIYAPELEQKMQMNLDEQSILQGSLSDERYKNEELNSNLEALKTEVAENALEEGAELEQMLVAESEKNQQLKRVVESSMMNREATLSLVNLFEKYASERSREAEDAAAIGSVLGGGIGSLAYANALHRKDSKKKMQEALLAVPNESLRDVFEKDYKKQYLKGALNPKENLKHAIKNKPLGLAGAALGGSIVGAPIAEAAQSARSLLSEQKK